MQVMNARATALSNSYVGTPRLGYNQEWATHVVHFNQFGTLSTWVTGEIVESPEFMLVGNQWRVEMYPSEDEISYPRNEDEISDEVMVSFYLQNMSNNTIDVEYGFSVKDRGGTQLAITTHHTFDPVHQSVYDENAAASRSTELSGWGFEFAKKVVSIEFSR